MNYRQLPKIELHLHLDCSLSYNVVKKLRPKISPEDYRKEFVAPDNCGSLVEYIRCASASIDLMQTKEQLELVTLDLFEQLQNDNVVYAEIRFAPLQHLKKGLTANEVVQAVNDGITKGIKETGIIAGLILCSLRHFNEKQSMQTIQLVHQFKNSHVVGFDLAADEAGYPVDAHKPAFEYAKAHGIPCTCHAGEACGPENVWEAIDELHVERIGHGVRSYEDAKLMTYLKKKNIHLEVCPTSNLKTGIYSSMAEHNIDNIYKNGISLSVNTDGRSLSDVTLCDEYEHMRESFNWQLKDYLAVNLFAVEAAFAEGDTKLELKKKLEKAYRV